MVRIVALNDNRCSNENFGHEHGISLYIECYGKKILLIVVKLIFLCKMQKN